MSVDAGRVDLSRVDDIHTICSLIKAFLRSLPLPLIPCEHYFEFTDAVTGNERSQSPSDLLLVSSHARRSSSLLPATNDKNNNNTAQLVAINLNLSGSASRLSQPLYENSTFLEHQLDLQSLKRASIPLHMLDVAAQRAERRRRLRRALERLPRAHLATLRFLIAHLVRVASYSRYNLMGVENLSTVFAPTLMRSPHAEMDPLAGLANVKRECAVVEALVGDFDAHFGADEQPATGSPNSHSPVPTDAVASDAALPLAKQHAKFVKSRTQPQLRPVTIIPAAPRV